MFDYSPDDWRQRLLFGWGRDLRIAVAFLTRLPIPVPNNLTGGDLEDGALAGAARAFPLVGLGLGALAGGVYLLALGLGLTPWLAAVLTLAAQVLLTGALHEDALGDVADGFGGGGNKSHKLQIMRDSQVGTYAVVAIALALALRGGALTALAEAWLVFAALIAAGAASRCAVLWVMFLLEPARNDGLGSQAGQPEMPDLIIASGLAVVVTIVGLGFSAAILALVATAIAGAAVAWLAQRQIGGHTGDVLGTIQQCAEIGFLLALVMTL